MSDEFPHIASAEIPSTNQKLFVRYFTAILTDLVVLNLFAEFWRHVVIDSFSIALLAAVLLQILLNSLWRLNIGSLSSSTPAAARRRSSCATSVHGPSCSARSS